MYTQRVLLLVLLSPGTFSPAGLFGQMQSHKIPYVETFDSVSAPALPSGWQTTSNRTGNGDFTTTASVPFSDSNAVISTNAAITQTLTSPALDFTNQEADSLIFYERRSGSHNSGYLVEASIDDGVSFSYQVSDTLKNPGITSYVVRQFKLPSALSNLPKVKIRWRVIGNGTGTTGTIRIDNVAITGRGQFDAAVSAITFSPQFPGSGDSVTVQAAIRNAGSQSLENIPVEFFEDKNNDSLPDPDELLASTSIKQILLPSDTAIAKTRMPNLNSGQHVIIVRTRLPADENPSNDSKHFLLTVGFAKQSLVINEIMYEPRVGHAEYVEIYNRSSQEINVKDWRLSDVVDTSSTSKVHVISQSSLVIRSGEFLVIASDSSILKDYPYLVDSLSHSVVKRSGVSLNNGGDDIIFSDGAHRTIDSLHYFPNWHNADVEDMTGRALERINPNLSSNDKRNWSTSANPTGGTPGRQNSLYATAVPSTATLSFSPNPFSPDGDGFEDVTVMIYRLASSTSVIRARIYDANGRLIRTLANSEPSGSHGEIIWDGFTDRGERARMGIYVVLLEALDGLGGNLLTVKGVVVVAAKL